MERSPKSGNLMICCINDKPLSSPSWARQSLTVGVGKIYNKKTLSSLRILGVSDNKQSCIVSRVKLLVVQLNFTYSTINTDLGYNLKLKYNQQF